MDKSLAPVFDRLQKSMVDLLEEVKDQPDSVLNTKPEKGGWSILQVIYHIILVEEASMRYVTKKLSFGDDIPKAGLKAYGRAFFMRNMFYLPSRVEAPEAVNESKMPDEIRFWESIKKWKEDRAELETFLNEMPPHLIKSELFKHPFSGKMTPKNMLLFFELHFKRHRKQIRKVLAEVKYVV